MVITANGYLYSLAEIKEYFPEPDLGIQMRGSHFTFNVEKLLQDLQEAKDKGVKDFQIFDYKKKDPVPNQIHFDKKKHQIVFVEGLFILTN